MKNFSAAAGHAATHLYFNPTSNIAKSNIEFYRSLKELSKDDLRPLYTKAYRDLYEEGQALYNNDEYDKMVVKFEEALKEYYEEIERCRYVINKESGIIVAIEIIIVIIKISVQIEFEKLTKCTLHQV